MEWYLAVVKNYVGFSGRARRKEFWMFYLISWVIMIALGVIDTAIGTGGILSTVYSLAVLLPTFAVISRRLHDTGRSAWWMLIGIIPVIGTIALLIFFAQEGKAEENKWGSSPKPIVA